MPTASTTSAPAGTADPEYDSRSLLRFITCGSVDDGKSTLIGRLMYEAGAVPEDQVEALRQQSAQVAGGPTLDFALLCDGLAAEREQGITIDVAHRYFGTAARRFIAADTPGHEQYTRNMVTGASTADLAIILVDARKGIQTQTRRHAYLVNLLGVRHLVLAVTKMDIMDFSRAEFDRIVAEFQAFANGIGAAPAVAIPVSGLLGDNVRQVSDRMPWYVGPPLLRHLETVEVEVGDDRPLRFPVQLVNRTSQDFRGYAGTVRAGLARPGDPVRILPSGRQSRVDRIVGFAGDLPQAEAGQAVTLTLADPVDCARGDMIVAAESPAEVADQFQCTIVWLAEAPLLPGRSYWLKSGTRTVSAWVTDIRHQVDVNTLDHIAARTLGMNGIALCHISLDAPIPFDPYSTIRDTGSFILIDRETEATVGAGLIQFALRRAGNVHWQALDVDKAARAALLRQRPCVVWFTGLSGAGKSTIANLVERKLHALGHATYLLDGDNVRHGLNRDLGFTEADRVENIRRVAEVAKLMVDAGLIVLTSFIAPFRAERRWARDLFAPGEFLEVFIDTPLVEAERRDPKGLYRRARAGILRNFTGVDSPYEPPERPDIHIQTLETGPAEAADRIVAQVLNHHYRS